MAKLAIWSLNRATQLIGTTRRQNRLKRIFADGHDVEFGKRADQPGSKYNYLEESAKQVDPNGSALHAAAAKISPHSVQQRAKNARDVTPCFEHRLMHESHTLDEYFVPIPLKCLGDARRFLGANPPLGLAADASELTRIVDSAANPYFDENEEAWLAEYWETGTRDILQDFPKVRMNTDPNHRCGYYELLTEYSAANGDCDHVLIGYSQGGLVAKYLAYLDRHVFNRNKIRAVITVGAPNFGSPLANQHNTHSVVNGLIQMIFAFFGRTLAAYPHTHAVLRAIEGHSVHDVARIMDAVIDDYLDHMDDDAKSLAAVDNLRSLRKWMTGIVGEEMTAFGNLSIENYDRPGSVLEFMDRLATPEQCYFGAVINANSSLPDFLKPVAGIVVMLDKWFRKIDLVPAGEIYSKLIMSENGGTDSPRAQELLQLWKSGIPEGGLPGRPRKAGIDAYDHDFIIPSIRMLAEPDRLLGNLVSGNANHLTGGSYALGPGKENFRLIEELLQQLEVRLP